MVPDAPTRSLVLAAYYSGTIAAARQAAAEARARGHHVTAAAFEQVAATNALLLAGLPS